MASDADTLYLIDGSGFIYRAYFGIRSPIIALDGTPVNAVHGFIRTILNVLERRQPKYVAVVFEDTSDTFRRDIFPEYKANRRRMPEDLVPQQPLCREAMEVLGIPSLEVPRYEADDVIATVAAQWRARGRDVVVVTKDKDLTQLVDEHVTLWDATKDQVLDRDGVVEKMGVPPEQVTEALGLAGDSSDNVPGVPGIGLKTAAGLLQQYGSLDALLDAAPTIKGKRGQALLENAAQAKLSVELVTLDSDAPVSPSEEDLTRRPHDDDALAAFLRALDFRDLLAAFGLKDHVTVGVDRSEYRVVRDWVELSEVVTAVREAGRMALHLGLRGGAVTEVAVAWAPGRSARVTLEDVPNALEMLAPLLGDPTLPKFGQDVKAERLALERAGVPYVGVAADAVLLAHLIDPNRNHYRLPGLSQDMLGHTMVDGRGANEDADVTLQLCELLLPRARSLGLEPILRELELPLTGVLAKMEARGVLLDTAVLEAHSAEAATKMAALEAEIHDLAGHPFNIDSPKQLAELLFEELGLPVIEKTKTGPSTNAKVLEQLAEQHPLPEKVLAFRHLSKLKGTYLDKLPTMVDGDGRLHTTYHQIGAATGRIASSDPNLQNIPVRTEDGRRIRAAFVAQPGWKLLSADYSQIELRILAHYSKDPALLSAFADEVDVHTRTAAEVFGVSEADVTGAMRTQAKAVNFGLMYGQGAYGLARTLGIEQGEAKAIIGRYFLRYAGVKQYYDRALEQARSEGQATTLFGRVRPLPEINTARRFQVKAQQERLAINTPIQGTAADVLKRAMVRLDRRIESEGLRSRMLLTVHDELVLEVPEEELHTTPEVVRAEMVGAAELEVPLVVDLGVGPDWGAAK